MGRTPFLPDQAELKQLVAQPVWPGWDWLVTTNTSLDEAGLKSQAKPGSPTFLGRVGYVTCQPKEAPVR